MTEERISKNDDFESISINYYPFGRTSFMKRERATVILSGLRHLKTNNFLKGVVSSFFHSRGNLTS
jgi:hypothetical protein